ncbi:hypothetical protein ColKHC_14332 [Colletotrichum higginsianum]|nr:hypothetical protein ColKHC_14332 [Colletotrichum higginsianum]
MVRKKSGELVRPAFALLPLAGDLPACLHTDFLQAVHFDSHLEHVRHFLQVDRPLAVSAGSSPVDNYDSDTEYPFPGDERRSARTPLTNDLGVGANTRTRFPKRSRPHDRFTFTIKLSDLANLETKTLFFCIRYNVNGQEFGTATTH